MPIKKIAIIIFLMIQAAAAFLFFQNKQFDFACETVLIMLGAYGLIHFSSKLKQPLPDNIAILVLLSLSGHNVIGYLLNWYVLSNVFDKYLHIFGTYSFSLLGYFYLQLNEIPLTNIKKLVLTMMIGLSLATLYELVEFAMDYFIQPAVPAQSGLLDTNLDLLGDLLGGLAAGWHTVKKY